MKYVLMIVAIAVAVPAAGQPAADRTNALVAAFKAVKKAPEGKKLSPADVAANSAAYKALDGFFDFDRMTSDAIKAHQSKLNAAQLAEFKTHFRTLIRIIGYPDSGDFLRKAKTSVRAGKGNDVVLDTLLEEDDVELAVTFRFHRGGGALRVYDVLFDGDSLMGDYSNQFGRLITKRGVDGLIKLLKERIAKVTRERGAVD